MGKEPKKIAVLSTVFHPASHTDVIVSRWLEPFPSDALYGWSKPGSIIASIYVAQKTAGTDLTALARARYGVKEFETIEGALTLGGEDLAVDAVFLIAEHGDYPENEFHQKLYPRKEFFDALMRVFERSGRVVPVFFDKHLSWKPEWIEEMHRRIKENGLPFFAGSSVPHSLPESLASLPDGLAFEEVVAVYFNSLEAYFFHSAEFVESVIERRESSKSGIESITAWEGAGVWDAIDHGIFSWDLVEAACASAGPLEAIRAHRDARAEPVYAFQIRYCDGLKVTHFMQRNIVRKWCLAARLKNSGEIISGAVQSSGADHYYPHFATLCRKIEDFIQSGLAPVPLERIRTTSLTTALAMQALASPGKTLPTPQLNAHAPTPCP